MSSLQPLWEGVGVQMVPNWLDKSAQIIFVSDNVKKRGLNDLIWGIRAQFWGRFFSGRCSLMDRNIGHKRPKLFS